MENDDLVSPSAPRHGWPSALVVGLLVCVAIVAVPLALRDGGESNASRDREVTTDEALMTVRAAIGRTAASGSYEARHEIRSTSGTGSSAFTAQAHSVVNFDPYVFRSVSYSSPYGPRLLYVTATTVWLTSGTEPEPSSGTPLSSFASSVESTLGPSQGALSMISMASPGGALNLEEAAVADATPDGTGSVDGVDVTYYDVTIDMTQLAETPDLSPMQRATIEAALPRLRQGGYRGTTERIGIDHDGYVRVVTATNHFTDGSTGVNHTILSNFGCAPRIHAPGTPTAADVASATCTTPGMPDTTSPTTTAATAVPPTSEPTTTADVDAIRDAFAGWFAAEPGDDLGAYVEDYASIRDAHLEWISQRAPEMSAQPSALIATITVRDAAYADVTYTAFDTAATQHPEQHGYAVKVEGTWKVSRDTACDLLSLDGISCPPTTTATTAK